MAVVLQQINEFKGCQGVPEVRGSRQGATEVRGFRNVSLGQAGEAQSY